MDPNNSSGGIGDGAGPSGGPGAIDEADTQLVLLPDLGVFRKFQIWVKRGMKRGSYILKGSIVRRWKVVNKWNISGTQFTNNDFSLNISSAMYLGLELDPDQFESFHDYCKYYFENLAQKQFGCHLVVTRSGCIFMCETGFSMNSAGHPGHLEYQYWRMANISAIYPVLFQESNILCLTLGLWFKDFTDLCNADETAIINHYYDHGWLRYYYRLINPQNYIHWPVRCGGVSELTEPIFFYNIYQNRHIMGANNIPKFAIYVCAGAKLIVCDDYHWSQTTPEQTRHHNRSLIQQGGVVVVERTLRLRTIDFSKNQRILSFIDAIDAGVINGPTAQAVRGYQYPVFFLGANHSDHNSIAWELMINRNKIPIECDLRIPEGGYIVAIENWIDGIEEIYARHRFEQHFRSNIQTNRDYTHLGYEAPNDQQMTNRILGVGIDRSLSCDIGPLIAPNIPPYTADAAIKPLEFNFSRPLELEEGELEREYNTYVMPALYPPIVIKGDLHDEIFYLPDRRFWFETYLGFTGLVVKPLDQFERHYKQTVNYNIRSNRLIISGYLQNEKYDFIFRLADQPLEYDEHKWVRSEYWRNPTPEYVQYTYRYGVDGNLYRISKDLVGPYRTRYYEFVEKRLRQELHFFDQFSQTFIEGNMSQPPPPSYPYPDPNPYPEELNPVFREYGVMPEDSLLPLFELPDAGPELLQALQREMPNWQSSGAQQSAVAVHSGSTHQNVSASSHQSQSGSGMSSATHSLPSTSSPSQRPHPYRRPSQSPTNPSQSSRRHSRKRR